MNDLDHMRQLRQIILEEFHMVPEDQIDTFVSKFSDWITAKVNFMVNNVHSDAVQTIHDTLLDPERGDPIQHGAIVNSPEYKRRYGTMKTFSEFNADQ